VKAARKFGPRFQARHAASVHRKIVYTCRGCGLQHTQMSTPAQCIKCGRMDFDRFDSLSEANRWAQLRFLEKTGHIADLHRQTRFDLFAYGPSGAKVKVAVYISDFDYVKKDGSRIVEDNKPALGIDDYARLKLKWMEAQGITVLLTST
jgi:hypothetical protein